MPVAFIFIFTDDLPRVDGKLWTATVYPYKLLLWLINIGLGRNLNKGIRIVV